MSVNLPEPIDRYFAADKTSDGDSVARCFTEDCVVKDEGNTYKGPGAVKKWKEDASSKYEYTCKPMAIDEKDDRIIVVCHLAGNFPGSPVDLRYAFQLESNKIKYLEITV